MALRRLLRRHPTSEYGGVDPSDVLTSAASRWRLLTDVGAAVFRRLWDPTVLRRPPAGQSRTDVCRGRSDRGASAAAGLGDHDGGASPLTPLQFSLECATRLARDRRRARVGSAVGCAQRAAPRRARTSRRRRPSTGHPAEGRRRQPTSKAAATGDAGGTRWRLHLSSDSPGLLAMVRRCRRSPAGRSAPWGRTATRRERAVARDDAAVEREPPGGGRPLVARRRRPSRVGVAHDVQCVRGAFLGLPEAPRVGTTRGSSTTVGGMGGRCCCRRGGSGCRSAPRSSTHTTPTAQASRASPCRCAGCRGRVRGGPAAHRLPRPRWAAATSPPATPPGRRRAELSAVQRVRRAVQGCAPPRTPGRRRRRRWRRSPRGASAPPLSVWQSRQPCVIPPPSKHSHVSSGSRMQKPLQYDMYVNNTRGETDIRQATFHNSLQVLPALWESGSQILRQARWVSFRRSRLAGAHTHDGVASDGASHTTPAPHPPASCLPSLDTRS